VKNFETDDEEIEAVAGALALAAGLHDLELIRSVFEKTK